MVPSWRARLPSRKRCPWFAHGERLVPSESEGVRARWGSADGVTYTGAGAALGVGCSPQTSGSTPGLPVPSTVEVPHRTSRP